jgi:hypothetical protein
VSPRLPSPGCIVIAALSLGIAAGCESSRESPASSIQREGSRGPHRFRLRSEIRPARLTLGDPATWTLSAELPREARALGVARDSAGPWMDVTAVREPAPGKAPEARGGTWELEYRVRAFDLGRIPLPRTAIVVAWPDPRPAGVPEADTLEFPPDTVTVDSLTTPETASLEPDRGPVRPGLRAVDIALAAAGALLLVAAIAALLLLWRARRRKVATAGAAAPPEPPEVPFRRAVEALRQEVETLPRDVFYERLSLAVRAYLSAVTGVPALDRTTAEIEREFARDGRFGPEALRALARTLDRSDLAKFARHEDQLAEARSALEEASSLPGHFSAPAPAPPQASPEREP